jgi:hypothetical protein
MYYKCPNAVDVVITKLCQDCITTNTRLGSCCSRNTDLHRHTGFKLDAIARNPAYLGLRSLLNKVLEKV